MSLSSGEDCETRMKVAGGSKRLVERVIASLDYSLSLIKRDGDSFDEEVFERLKPDLDVLIKITEDAAGLMKSRRDQDEVRLHEAERAIGDCNAKMVATKQHRDDVHAKLADGEAKAGEVRNKVAELQREIDENNRKIAELEEHKTDVAKFFWVPGYNLYLIGSALDDLCQERQPILVARLQEEAQEKDSSEEWLRALKANCDVLAGEERVMERRISDLEGTRTVFEQNCKVYSNKFALLSDVIVFYGLLRFKIENISRSLDLPEVIERLYESRELVQSNGEVHQVTLKEVLVHLGEDYDRSLEHGGLEEEAVSTSFKLLSSDEPLPSGYRLATVHEVTADRDALFKAMPSWEIANLVDGSVQGRSYGGSVSSQIRDDVGHKLAVITAAR